jgi:hypothetical protein
LISLVYSKAIDALRPGLIGVATTQRRIRS